MSNYRIAFLFCRSLSTFFFWSALFNGLAMTGALLGGGSGLLSFVAYFAVGIVLRICASTISSTLTGVSAFEGESLSNTFEKDAQFRALSRALTGLLLIVFGVSHLLWTTISLLTSYSFLSSSGAYDGYYGLALIRILPPFFQITLGLFLAFGGALKRLSQSMTGVESTPPDESASKSDSSS